MANLRSIKERVTNDFGPKAGIIAIGIIFLLLFPSIILIGLSLIGIEINWLNPWAWLGAIILTLALG